MSVDRDIYIIGDSHVHWLKQTPELLADEYISYYGNVGRAVVLCSIVSRVGPKNVSPETFTKRADRFNTHLKERCFEYFYLLFWNHGRLGPYTVQEKTKQKAIGHQPHR